MSQSYPDAQIVKANGADFYYIYYADGRSGQGGYDTLLAFKEGRVEEYLKECEAERTRLGIGLHREVKVKPPAKVKPQRPVQLSLF